MWLYSERKDDVIWSELKLGSQLELNAILFQSWSKIRSNSKLPSIIVTNISRSSPHTTLWFTEVRHQHLKTNLQGLLPRVHILIVSISNLKLPVFGLFSRFVHTLIIKISSSEEPANSTSIHKVRNGGKLVILFHLQKILQKGVDRPFENPRKGAKNFKTTPNAPNKFYRRMRRRDARFPYNFRKLYLIVFM